MKRQWIAFKLMVLIGTLLTWTGFPAHGYEEIEVTHGGTITGKVTLKGPIPAPRNFPLVLYPFGPFCKKISDGKGNVLLEEFIVGPDGGLQDAIVTVQGIERGKPFDPMQVKIVAVDCMFHPGDVSPNEQFAIKDGKLRHEHPLVMVFTNPQEISVINQDPVIHNSQVFQSEKGNIILNVPLPVSNDPRKGIVQFEPGKRIAQMICGMHEFMQTWGFAVDNPYYSKTRKDGGFQIDRLPPGTYKVLAWHPHLKPIEKTVVVTANGAVDLNFEFDGAEVKRPIYEDQRKFRIGPEALPHQHLESCEPPYCPGD